MSGKFDLGDYVGVDERMAELKDKYPDARLRPLDPSRPYSIETIGDQTFVVVVAACYLCEGADDPGVGMAWEPVPGATPYTRNSELQNAETSAWGRAIVAALVADTKRGVASADEVRNRRGEPLPAPDPIDRHMIEQVQTRVNELGDRAVEFTAWKNDQGFAWPWTVSACESMLRELDRLEPADDPEAPF